MEQTSRFNLPLLASGQAQKEITHNEALLLLDGLTQAAIESRTLAAPPASPQPGQMWLIAAAASGDWSGRSGQLALWTAGGWRYIAPRPGMVLWSKTDGAFIHHGSTGWQVDRWAVNGLAVGGVQVVGPRQVAIPDPSGGAAPDSPARAAISAILAALRVHGLIAP